MNSFQAAAPLTIGELWAWPSMLKLALIENLRRLAEEMLEARAAVRAADAYAARVDAAGRGTPPPLPSAPTPDTSISSSNGCANTARASPRSAPPWMPSRRPAPDRRGRAPERASTPSRGPGFGGEHHHQPPPLLRSRLEPVFRSRQPGRAVLQRDPAGAYGNMDFLSRDRYRQASMICPGPAARRSCRSLCGRSRTLAGPPRAGGRRISPPTSATT